MMQSKFTGHDKRVTLSLARCSAVCKEMPELIGILNKLPLIEYDLVALPQSELEVLYAEFDPTLEDKIRSEFEADPDYLIDLGVPTGVCPLCGHLDCRFIFKLQNNAGGQDIECGSKCIITYGISVKGAETAEEAKKFLEIAIRKAVKRAKISAWHKEYEFEKDYLYVVQASLHRIRKDLCDNWTGSWETRRTQIFEVAHAQAVLEKLITFYRQHGWLNTKDRWNSWLRVVNFVIANDAATADTLPSFKAWVDPVKGTRVKKQKAQLVLQLGSLVGGN